MVCRLRCHTYNYIYVREFVSADTVRSRRGVIPEHRRQASSTLELLSINENAPEERESHLHHLRVCQQQRLAAETHEEREARLHQVRVSRQQRFAAETSEEREARRQHYKERHIHDVYYN